jgi:hypothetical protein
LAQALAVASLLVVVGLSLSPAMQWPAYLQGSDLDPDLATHTPSAVQPAQTEPFLGDEGLLSGLEVRALAEETAQQRRIMAKDTSPKFDPILKYRHDWRSAGSQASG